MIDLKSQLDQKKEERKEFQRFFQQQNEIGSAAIMAPRSLRTDNNNQMSGYLGSDNKR